MSVVALKNGEFAARCRSIPDLKVVEVRTQLDGFLSVTKNSLLHAHEARAVHLCWLHHLFFRSRYVITRRVQDPLKSRWLTRSTYAAASCVVALSKWIQAHLLDRCIDSVLIPSGIEPLVSAPLRPRRASSVFRILQLGALSNAHKGQTTAIHTLQQLPNFVTLTVVGDGPDRRMLLSMVKELGLQERVEFVSWQNDFLARRAVEFDCFIFPSNHEGLGSALLDAMNYAIPIVASNVGGIPDLIEDDVNGLLAEPGNPHDFARQIIKLINNGALSERLRQHARETVANYSTERMFRAYDLVYRQCFELKV